MDNRGARVAVFDSTGAWLNDVGARGEGPGEYTAPTHISLRGDTLFVWDARSRRFSTFMADGEFLGSVNLPNRASSQPFAAVARGYVIEVESGQVLDPAPAQGALVLAGRDGLVSDTVVGPYPVPERGWAVTEGTNIGHMVNPPALAVYPSWTVHFESVVWLDPIALVVEVKNLNSGVLERIVRLPYAATPPSSMARQAYFRGLRAEFGLSDEALAGERERTTFSATEPPVADVLVDDMGRLWVARHDPFMVARQYVGAGWDVVDISQAYVIHVRFPSTFRLLAIRGARACGITTLENGVQVVDCFGLDQGRLAGRN